MGSKANSYLFQSFIFRGTFTLDDVFNFGGIAERQKIHDLQSQLQFDDPINIQFTSVSFRLFLGEKRPGKLESWKNFHISPNND